MADYYFCTYCGELTDIAVSSVDFQICFDCVDLAEVNE